MIPGRGMKKAGPQSGHVMKMRSPHPVKGAPAVSAVGEHKSFYKGGSIAARAKAAMNMMKGAK